MRAAESNWNRDYCRLQLTQNCQFVLVVARTCDGRIAMHRTINESIRSRLEALNRAPLPATVPRAPAEAAAAPSRSLADRKSAFVAAAVSPQKLPGLLRSGEVVENSLGQHARICI